MASGNRKHRRRKKQGKPGAVHERETKVVLGNEDVAGHERQVDEGDQPRRDDSQDVERGNGGPHDIER